jgi:nucleotide-binding universal stress UspA family protein
MSLHFLLGVAAWLAIGAVAVAVMHRRGHDTFSWAILFVFLGPLAVPLAVSSERHLPAQPDWPDHEGTVDVLVVCDGSVDSARGLDAALDLLAGRLTSLTLAAVIDAEAATTVRGRTAQQEMESRLDAAALAARKRTSAPVDSVVLFGEPCRVLGEFAAAHGYELIVGPTRVARQAPVPVLVGPPAR